MTFYLVIGHSILVIFLYLGGGWANFLNDKSCARLYENRNFEGEEFQIKDGVTLTNLEETHLRLEKNWNVTESFRVESGCLFTACNESHFNGVCQEFTSDASTKPDAFKFLLSANCTCSSNCKCSDVFMRKTSCARAYLDNGCNTCNALYTDLKDEKDVFPNEFVGRVKSLMVRKGCSLTLFEEEDYEGEKTILRSKTVDWNRAIGSYQCKCSKTSKKTTKRRPANSPEYIDIPSTADRIIPMMKTKLGKHPGLVAALRSIKAKRSPTNAYILLVGLTGSGKSSAINLLFDNPNVTLVGDELSTTSDIHEFRIRVPVDHLGIKNSELRVIDTPGLGDTRGLEQDARYLATLEEYFNNHEELRNKIPNIVLVFSKFHDNRFEGPGSTFVKMLRGLDSFRDRITDNKFSNVIFVLSHFMSASKLEQRRPARRIKSFKSVIEEYSLFPKPISIVVAENRAAEHEVPLLNGYYKLPNGDFYPEKIQTATSNGNDPVGEAVFRTAFSNSDDFNISSSTHRLVTARNNKVPKYLAQLSANQYDNQHTEVSQLLATAFTEMPSSLHLKFPDALPYLQRIFNLRNIMTRSDVPRTTNNIIQFLKGINQNEANSFLMEKAFGLVAPTLKQNILTGYGYNVIEDKPLTKSPFVLGDARNSDIGYMFPDAMTCNIQIKSDGMFKLFQNREDYLTSRLKSLNVNGAIPIDSFKGEIQPGYNLQSEALGDGKTKISAVKEYRTFELVLNDRVQLNEEFTATVRSLPKYIPWDHQNVEIWKNFFANFGTHIVKSTHGGGSIEILLTSNSTFGPEVAFSIFEIIEFAEDITMGIAGNKSLDSGNTEYQLKFRGGDQKFHATELKSLSLTDAADLLENWKESLEIHPSILLSEMRLLPMNEVTRKLGLNISLEIETAALDLFNISMGYRVPRPSASPPKDRQVTGAEIAASDEGDMSTILEGLRSQFQMNNERIQEAIRNTNADVGNTILPMIQNWAREMHESFMRQIKESKKTTR